MTRDELRALLADGAAIKCEGGEQKHNVILELHGMGFKCSGTIKYSTNMGFPYVVINGNCVDAVHDAYVKDRVTIIIPADEVLGIMETPFVLMDLTSLLV